jgi:hypothetical protein
MNSLRWSGALTSPVVAAPAFCQADDVPEEVDDDREQGAQMDGDIDQRPLVGQGRSDAE